MPELPEVETVVRGLRRRAIHRKTIESVSVNWARSIAGISPDKFVRSVIGRHITTIRRRAKFIKLELSGHLYMLIHLRMTGSLRVESSNLPADPYDRVILDFTGGQSLRFRDTRKFGRWYITDDPDQILGRLGPEPLSKDFTAELLIKMMRTRKRMLKPLLLDQNFISGLGNIYVDEALFAAGLHPCQIASELDQAEVIKLHHSIQSVLREGISRMGTSLGNGMVNFYSVSGRRGRNQDALQVFRRDGDPCRVCGRTIQRLIVGQRGTHICPHCQPAP
jgi:formamidopyrimidine-DNA glycosylase